MKARHIAILIIAALTVAYVIAFPSVTVRYRLTLEVETPEGLRSGAGVWQTTYSENLRLLGSNAQISIDVRGEAVIADLGPRGILFALLRAGDHPRSGPDYIVPMTFTVTTGGVGPENFSAIGKLTGKRELPLEKLPLLVRFRDIADPLTVEKVEPENLAKSFGAGVRLRRVTIEIVPAGIWPLNAWGLSGAPITTGIEKQLPWIREYYGKKLDGQRFESADAPNRIANSLSSGSFGATR